MKLLNKICLLGAILLMPAMGCEQMNQDLVDLNINPTQAEEVDWRFMLTRGMVEAVENRYSNGRVHLSLCSSLIQQMSTLEVGGERGGGDKYFRTLDAFNAYMFRLYPIALKTLGEVIRQTGPDGSNPSWTNTHHIAQIMYAWPMHIMTDIYGNVPYSEANKGVEGIFFPKYDEQEFIYKDMLAKLEAAATNVGSGPDDVGSADLMFNGDYDKWKRFANSMILRFAMRISNADAATAQEYAVRAIGRGVMTSNDDAAVMPMAEGPSQWFNQNGLSRAMIPDDWGAQHMVSKTLVDYLQEKNDPRLRIYTVRGLWDGPWMTDPADQIGMPNGHDATTIRDFVGTTDPVDRETAFSRMHPWLLKVDAPYVMMNYPEVEFLLAEAAVKGWTSDNAGDHYDAGVRAAMQMWTIFDDSFVVTDEEVDAYLAANAYDGTLETLMGQKWAANFMNWYEAYSDWRRSGLPVLTPVNYPGNVSGGQIFRRIEYYTVEVATNPNLQTGGTMPDDVMTRVWWDKN